MNNKGSRSLALKCFLSSFGICVVVVSTAVYFSFQAHQNYQYARESLSRELAGVFLAKDNAEFMHQSADVIARLRSENKIGKQDKLSWVQILTELGVQVPVQNFQFEMSPAQTVLIEASELQQIDITLSGKLSHDGMLERFFVLLADSNVGSYQIQELEVLREEPPEGSDAEAQPDLDLLASIRLYAVSPAGDDEVASL